jgi:DNA-binding transcriptional MerR regulator
MARASGLTVSALRFYDGAGILVPASVDPGTGYRRYGDHQLGAARLIAGLRRVGLPLAEITQAVRDPASVRPLLDRHLTRLTNGLADARREIARIHAHLDLEDDLMTRITLPAAALAAGLDAVRFAASTDPDLPPIGGILLDTEDGDLTLVATDRYRLATARAAAEIEGPPGRTLVPLPLADAVRPLLTGDGPVVCTADDDRVVFEVAGHRLEGAPVDAEFPHHRPLVRIPDPDRIRRITIDPSAIRAAVTAAPSVTHEESAVVILNVDPAGSLRCADEREWVADEEAHVAVNREFLLQALDAGGSGQLVLELDGPIHPLRLHDGDDRMSLLMPVRR